MRRIPLPRLAPALALALALLAVLPRAPLAQANRSGFFVGFDPIAYAALHGDSIVDGRTQGGTGIALRFGWGFGEQWAIVMDVPVTDIAVSDTMDVMLSHGDVLLLWSPRAFMVSGRTLLPYLQAGVGFRSLDGRLYIGSTPHIYALEGEVFSIGAGARLYVAPAFALTLQAMWSDGHFNDERLSETTTHGRGLRASSYRVQSGIEWHRLRKPRGAR